jgi:predicted MFS family arabinose efflux permease
MAVMGLLVLFVSNGFTATAVSVFDEALLGEFGWERGPFKFANGLNFAITAVLAPFVGIVIDRLNPKRLLVTGLALLAGAYLAFSRLGIARADSSIVALGAIALAGLAVMLVIIWRSSIALWLRACAALVVVVVMAVVIRYAYVSPTALGHLYVIYVVFSLALSTAGTMVVIVLVSSWFLEHRGLAIGIALLGTSAGGIVLSPVNAWLIENVGWRASFAWLALLPVAVAVLVLVLVRGTPKETGAVAIGQEAGARELKQFGLTLAEAIRTPTFWAIGASGFLTYYSILALFNHLFLHMRGLGFEPQTAARSLALLGLMAAISKLAIGWAADYVDRKRVFLACLAVMFAGVLGIAALGRDYIWPAIFVTGVGWGGLFTLYNMLTVNNFGLKEIGRINGTISFLESLGGGLGIWLTGELFDVFGSYEVPFDVIAGCVFVGLLVGTRIRSGSPQAMGLAPAAAS